MFTQDQLFGLLLALPVILLALSAHEFAHGYISKRLGDPTAERAGRLTLLPWRHLDPIGTIMLIISSLSGFGFGWAKPVPINPAYYRNPVRGTLFVSLAGPVANFLLAIFFALLFRLVNIYYLTNPEVLRNILRLLYLGVVINLSLGIFNLIPIPPLDGSGILAYFLRGRAREFYQRMRAYGFLLLMLLIFTGAFRYVLVPVLTFLLRFLLPIG